jgi:glycosyltransferase involved in cell wall biosynthesis
MKRPTIALCCIAKNEAGNIEKLTKSVEGCFDKLYLTDTGSTDNTVEIAKKLGWEVSHFEWVHDFSKARNFNFSQSKEDYVMWLDLDDLLTGRDGFIKWRDNSMQFADYWLATYDYAHDHEGKPAVSFARERVVKNRHSPTSWKHFLHEGIPGKPGETMNMVPTTVWKVSHQRTAEDLANDKGRNLKIFENYMKDNKLDARMKFYYGKELFEIQRPDEAIHPLLDAASDPVSEPHDRLLAIQYAAFACMSAAAMLNPQNITAKEKADKLYYDAIKIAGQGLQLDSHRAEYWTVIGDSYVKLSKLKEAIPYYSAAMKCEPVGLSGQAYSSPIFSFLDTSTKYPRNQLIRCYFHLGNLSKAKELAEETQSLYPNEETKIILEEIKKQDAISNGYKTAKECDDIVFTCPMQGMYEWDEEIYKTKGMGGSETACIEMAKNLKEKTGKRVIVFNGRAASLVASSGVEYRPSAEIADYMSKHKPSIHIAWRHNIKCTDARTYLWCHDLYTPSVESVQNFDKQICLSQFHKRYVSSIQGLPENKIWVSRNGIVPERFKDRKNIKKNPMKLVYPSSPDRGLDKLIKILDIVRSKHPVELHVFYGFENLYKSGPAMTALADSLKLMISERPWITYHGNTEQKELTKHICEASLWVHPANFIESFCITAIETICAGTYPITRTLGALQDTLREASQNSYAYLFETNGIHVTEDEYAVWANKVCEALETKIWEKIDVSPEKYSWSSVADEWIDEMGLNSKAKLSVIGA